MRPSFFLLALALLPLASRAEVQPFPCSQVWDPNDAPVSDPRLAHLIVSGVPVNVLVPPLFGADPDRRYPVLYLFHGAFGDEDSWTTQTDLLARTAMLDDDDQVIAVMPNLGALPTASDWVDGLHPQETFVVQTLVPWVDANYRTRAERSQRAAAGFSGGGLDAMILAERHPDLFVAAGSFSGFLDPYSPVGQQVAQQFTALDDQLCGATFAWTDIWGDPLAHPMGWEAHDPVFLPGNLEDTSVYLAVGNGTPCPSDVNPDPFLEYIETVALGMAQTFDAGLTAAGVRHTVDYRACGLHQFANAGGDLARFWPQMLRAFGRPPPHELDFDTGDAAAAVWGWSFAVDPARAPEFLAISRASRRGLRVTGSGTASVVTAPFFRPFEPMRVGAVETQADAAGRVAFTVDLGPPHTLEQGTPAELAAAAADPSYFVTREVEIHPSHAP